MKATYSGSSKVKIGAVVVYKGTILAKSHNSDKTCPTQEKYNDLYRFRHDAGPCYYAAKGHAEMRAIQKIKYLDIDFSKVTIYIFREFKRGGLALASPCEACYHAIYDLGIRHVCYTTEHGYAEEWYK